MADTQQQLKRGAWSEDEHKRFLAAMQQFPKGPWKTIAESIGTRSVRQVQTHAQQHHEKSARTVLGLRRDRKKAPETAPYPQQQQQQQTGLQQQEQEQEHEFEVLVHSSELVSLWRELTAQSETDGILALTSPSQPNRSVSENI